MILKNLWQRLENLDCLVLRYMHNKLGGADVSSVSPSSEGINYERSDDGLNARNVSTSLLPYGGITYLINSFDYPNLLCFNSPPTQHQFLYKTISTILVLRLFVILKKKTG